MMHIFTHFLRLEADQEIINKNEQNCDNCLKAV